MAQYDVYADGPDAFLIDVQDNHLREVNSRIVIPLIPEADATIISRKLNPVLMFEGAPLALETHLMAAVSAGALVRPIGNLSDNFSEITRALDFVFHGF